MRNAAGLSGPVVLETTDLRTFTFAAGYTSPVMTAPWPFTSCKAFYDPEFDLNYASPGSVLQDPTRPPGNLMMIYEAENHCPGAVWQHDFYATVGFARSSDNGKTWPAPVDAELGGTDRYPVLKSATPEPSTPESPQVAMGNAIPSAFVDGTNLYVDLRRPGPERPTGCSGSRGPRSAETVRSASRSGTTARSPSPGSGARTAACCPRGGASDTRGWARSATTTRSAST